MTLSAVLVLAMFVTQASAIVLHRDEDEPASRPADHVIGRWSSNASCVAIGRENWGYTNYILTTRHQGGGIGTPVKFDGVSYVVSNIWVPPSSPVVVDLRICELTTPTGEPANLPNFTGWYTGRNEVGKDIVLGGYGKGRGSEIKIGNNLLGYYWSGTSNSTLRWGSNNVYSTGTSSAPTFKGDLLVFDFDDESTLDAAIAEWDSGGGWYIENSPGSYQVAALTHASQRYGESRFGDFNYGVRISSYADWIDTTLYSPIVGDADFDNDVDLTDLAVLASNYGSPTGATWNAGDFDADGDVDLTDLSLLASNWNTGTFPVEMVGAMVPEPASLALVGLAMFACRRRRV